jgi:mannosyltransferase OCH1-like enzyme
MGDYDRAILENHGLFSLFNTWTIPKPRVPPHATFKIPKVCYQTWSSKSLDDLTPSTREVVEKNRLLNPDIRFELWDDADIDAFMAKEFPGEINEAFKQINRLFGAARADFFRYCILSKHGGLYLVIKSGFKQSHFFGSVLLPDDEALLDVRKDIEAYRVVWGYGAHEQWFLAFAPKHPYLERMIARIVRSVQRHLLPPAEDTKKMILRITGPDALAAAIHDAIIDYGLRHREINYNKYLRYSASGVLRNPEYNSTRKHYSELDRNTFYKQG